MFDGRGMGATIDASLEALGSPLFVFDENGDSLVTIGLEQALGWMVDVIDGIGQIGTSMNGVHEVLPRVRGLESTGERRN